MNLISKVIPYTCLTYLFAPASQFIYFFSTISQSNVDDSPQQKSGTQNDDHAQMLINEI